MLLQCFLNSYDWIVVVSEDTLKPGDGESSIVSFAIWDVSYKIKRRNPSHNTQDRMLLTLLLEILANNYQL